MEIKLKIKKICEQCGKEINPSYRISKKDWIKRKFCSIECHKKHENPAYKPGRQAIFCSTCGKKLLRWPCEISPEINRCFRCQFKALEKAGKKTRIKRGQRLSQKTEFKKGSIPWNKDKKPYPHIEKILRKLAKEIWVNEKYLFNTIKGQMFGKEHKLNKLDKEIIRTRVQLFKSQSKEIKHER